MNIYPDESRKIIGIISIFFYQAPNWIFDWLNLEEWSFKATMQ